MRRGLKLLFLAAIAGGCRTATPPPDAGAPAAGAPGLRVVPKLVEPPAIEAAVALRRTEPHREIERLEALRAEAVDAGAARTAALALDHLGDVWMDLQPRWESLPFEERFGAREGADGGFTVPDESPCEQAERAYQRALTLAQLLDEPRLTGRIAHDLGWCAEKCAGGTRDAIVAYEVALAARRRDLDAKGVRMSANNLGRLLLDEDPRRAHALLLEALAAAGVAHDLEGQRKINSNLAREWWFDRDPQLLEPDGGTGAGRPERVKLPFDGVARVKALAHASAALEAALALGLPPSSVCEAISLVDCDSVDGGVEAFFPERDEE